ncbi:MAG: hypothetical protein V4702_00905 [Patescibacteria group bacterium]
MEAEKLLAALVASLAINEFIHIIFEIWGIRQKVAWLAARLDKKPHGKWPINIDSLVKTLALHLTLFIFFVGLAFLWLTLGEFSTQTLLKVSIFALIVTYAYTVLGMDAYHSDIGKLLTRYKRHIKK